MDIEIFEVEAGQWAYRVGGVYQEWHPDQAGFVPMSEVDAMACATVVAARFAGE